MHQMELCLMLILLLALCFCLSRPKRICEEFGESGSSVKSGEGLLDRKFEDDRFEAIQYLKLKTDKWIRPTLKHFLKFYEHDAELEQEYRMSKLGEITKKEREAVEVFVSRVIAFNTSELFENTSPGSGDTSYTLGKSDIYMCVRDISGNLHSKDIILFAYIHELAHCGCESIGHSDEFWAQFRFLLYLLCHYEYEGEEEKEPILYCSVDLREQPYFNYCSSMNVHYNPLFDEKAFLTF